MLAAAGLAAVVIGLISWIDHRGYLPAGRDHANLYEGRSVRVAQVIDGDTIDVVDQRRPNETTRVRLWGIDTPEIAKPWTEGDGDAITESEPFGDEATAMTKQLCDGQTVRLMVQAHRLRGRYGRLLAYVQLPDQTLLNERLLTAGLARADGRFAHQWSQRFELLEQQARFDGVGMWAGRRR